MNSVEVDGSQAGDNILDASGMTMGVYLMGYGSGNQLYGGAGPDTLVGGSGDDYLLDAGNNSDVLYVSGNNSSYYGTGSNTLIYLAQPNDKSLCTDGLLIEWCLVFGDLSMDSHSSY